MDTSSYNKKLFLPVAMQVARIKNNWFMHRCKVRSLNVGKNPYSRVKCGLKK